MGEEWWEKLIIFLAMLLIKNKSYNLDWGEKVRIGAHFITLSYRLFVIIRQMPNFLANTYVTGQTGISDEPEFPRPN